MKKNITKSPNERHFQTEEAKEMNKITNKMADLFDKNITASSLAEWIAIISYPKDKPKEVSEFTWNFGFLFLPDFIKCNSKTERIEYSKKEIVQIFDTMGKEVLCEAIGLIGIEHFREFSKRRSDEDMVREFMAHLTTFACLCEMYDDYVFYKEKSKEIK